MENIIDEIIDIIEILTLQLQDNEIKEKSLRDIIKVLLDYKIVDLIEKEIEERI